MTAQRSRSRRQSSSLPWSGAWRTGGESLDTLVDRTQAPSALSTESLDRSMNTQRRGKQLRFRQVDLLSEPNILIYTC